jgi:hypothetical protein
MTRQSVADPLPIIGRQFPTETGPVTITRVETSGLDQIRYVLNFSNRRQLMLVLWNGRLHHDPVYRSRALQIIEDWLIVTTGGPNTIRL